MWKLHSLRFNVPLLDAGVNLHIMFFSTIIGKAYHVLDCCFLKLQQEFL